jgi:hypothetical protein
MTKFNLNAEDTSNFLKISPFPSVSSLVSAKETIHKTVLSFCSPCEPALLVFT